MSFAINIWRLKTVIRWLVLVLSVWCASGRGAYAQKPQTPAGPSQVPVIDAEVGSCSVQFTVTDGAGAVVYNAKIRVQFAYGFLSLRKLDLEIGTNSDGKARFEGLPNKGRALRFQAGQDDRKGSAVYNPTQKCGTEHALIVLKD